MQMAWKPRRVSEFPSPHSVNIQIVCWCWKGGFLSHGGTPNHCHWPWLAVETGEARGSPHRGRSLKAGHRDWVINCLPVKNGSINWFIQFHQPNLQSVLLRVRDFNHFNGCKLHELHLWEGLVDKTHSFWARSVEVVGHLTWAPNKIYDQWQKPGSYRAWGRIQWVEKLPRERMVLCAISPIMNRIISASMPFCDSVCCLICNVHFHSSQPHLKTSRPFLFQ